MCSCSAGTAGIDRPTASSSVDHDPGGAAHHASRTGTASNPAPSPAPMNRPRSRRSRSTSQVKPAGSCRRRPEVTTEPAVGRTRSTLAASEVRPRPRPACRSPSKSAARSKLSLSAAYQEAMILPASQPEEVDMPHVAGSRRLSAWWRSTPRPRAPMCCSMAKGWQDAEVVLRELDTTRFIRSSSGGRVRAVDAQCRTPRRSW